MALTTAIALSAAGLAVSAGSTAASFAQAGKQRSLQSKAEAEAARAMEEAKKELQVNYSAALGLQKEPYELQREALLSAGAQSIEAGRESERGAGATAGRIYALQQQGQRQIASEMGEGLSALEKATAEEAAKLRNARADLSLKEAEGAQVAAKSAEQMGAAYTKDAFSSVASGLQQAAQFVPLYEKSQSARAFEKTGTTFQNALANPEIQSYANKTYGVDFSKAPTDATAFKSFITSNLTAEQIKNLNEIITQTIPQAKANSVTNSGQINTNPLFDMGMYGVGGF